MLVTFNIHKQSYLNKTVKFKNEQRAKWYLDNRTLKAMGVNHYSYDVQSESETKEAITEIRAYNDNVVKA